MSFKKYDFRLYLIYFSERYYIYYIVSIIEKNKYNLLQYESLRYQLSIFIILIKIKLKSLFIIYTH